MGIQLTHKLLGSIRNLLDRAFLSLPSNLEEGSMYDYGHLVAIRKRATGFLRHRISTFRIRNTAP